MQIMNLEKIVKNLWWSLTAFRTINNLPDSIIFIDFQGTIERANRKAYECFGFKIDDSIISSPFLIMLSILIGFSSSILNPKHS